MSTLTEKKLLKAISGTSHELLRIVGKHSTLWNYSKWETVEKINELLEGREPKKEAWICPRCACVNSFLAKSCQALCHITYSSGNTVSQKKELE